MGIEDRDWYREAVREREGRGKPRRRITQRDLDSAVRHEQQPAGWGAAIFRTVLYCLAVYGLLALIVRLFR